MVSDSSEKTNLEAIAHRYRDVGSPSEHAVRRAAVEVVARFIPAGGSILELGCSEGYMTFLLSHLAKRHVVVDAAGHFLAKAKTTAPAHVSFVESLFEDFEPNESFDVVVMCYILEHVAEPEQLIARARRWLKPNTGVIFAAVPNARALSRQLGRALGVMKDLHEITPAEEEHGHRRTYDRAMLDNHVRGGGADALFRGGLVVKPLGTGQLDAMVKAGIISNEHFTALNHLAIEMPDLSHTIYTVAR